MKKVQLYIISLWLLFILVSVKEFNFISWQISFKGADISYFLSKNLISLISITLSLLAMLFYAFFSYDLKGSSKLVKKITKIEDQNFEHLTFLTTYIIPFLRVKLEGRDLIVTILLLIIIGAIFIKTNLFYKNPTLALLGYKLYKVDTEKKNGLIFISRQHLELGDNIQPMLLSDNIYFVRK